ncbi:Site-specific integrase [Vibrio crassostreae]|nr:Integrase bacteriophage P4 family [Vibrio chagasii]CAK1731128.1 Site-specific integrase [Vibrio crassostreae]CAH7002780.1 Integrase bacteriophage P4 family [Vibrio chagasii]CAH7203686.1 Integrase bacteriophage P4 family [Vibrio chagasii]CAH7392627.1 Integrase bacteriophage P4 family [Vibrio chagasii]
MAENKLSDSKLKTLLSKPTGKQVTLADGLGLSARVSPVGGISWLFRYRDSLSKKQIWLSLGKYPDLSIKQAREERDKVREWLANGKDPKIERKMSIQSKLSPVTVKDALDHWIEKYASENRSNHARHLAQFERWVYPTIGWMPLSQVSKHHWIECFEARSTKYPVAAGYVLRNVQQAIKFCEKRGYEVNRDVLDIDFDTIGAKRQSKKSRRLIEDESWHEFESLVKWLNTARIFPYYKNLIILLVSFGARTQEVRLSKSDEWDLDNLVWTVPPENNKTKKKDQSKGQSGEIKRPIPPQLVPMIQTLIKESRNGYILGEMKTAEAVSAWGGSVWKLVSHDEKWTFHDLRRTVATGMNDLGVHPHIVESMLGHSIAGVAGIYNRSHYLREKKDALEVWIAKLESLGLNFI